YNWYAVTDKRGLAPNGWRVPTAKDIIILLDSIGADWRGISKLASKGWVAMGGKDVYGFKAEPTGMRYANGSTIITNDSLIYNPRTHFLGFGSGVGYWTTSLFKWDLNTVCGFLLSYSYMVGLNKEDGLYVRCILEDFNESKTASHDDKEYKSRFIDP
ncbi:hypothetical protein D0T50_10190, partial [Bacteroides sp. 214]|uniref:fibrobacter succinogenes major paralogous domain-containing protein n=1 Tax=Bacteroides sp. 214 TaxID=2302935 RepID=UPI0019403620